MSRKAGIGAPSGASEDTMRKTFHTFALCAVLASAALTEPARAADAPHETVQLQRDEVALARPAARTHTLEIVSFDVEQLAPAMLVDAGRPELVGAQVPFAVHATERLQGDASAAAPRHRSPLRFDVVHPLPLSSRAPWLSRGVALAFRAAPGAFPSLALRQV